MFGRGIRHHWSARRAEVRRERKHRLAEIGMLNGLVAVETLRSGSAQDAMEDGPWLQRT